MDVLILALDLAYLDRPGPARPRFAGVVGNTVVKFNVVNLTKPDSLFAMGMRPVMYSHQEAAEKGLGWRRCGHDINYRRCWFVWARAQQYATFIAAAVSRMSLALLDLIEDHKFLPAPSIPS